jgi:hypothetical protein
VSISAATCNPTTPPGVNNWTPFEFNIPPAKLNSCQRINFADVASIYALTDCSDEAGCLFCLGAGVIVGIVVGGLIFLVGVALAMFYFRNKRWPWSKAELLMTETESSVYVVL